MIERVEEFSAELEVDSLSEIELTLNGEPALLHFARRQDVVAWAPTRLPE